MRIDRHINFDIQEEWYHKTEYVEKILSKAGLKSLNTHWEPERILRYVAIPSYSKTRIPSSTDASLGRTDMVDVFTWLRTRNVRKIIEVIIDDTIYPPHSDESIEKALRNLQIEILDWKREDIDIDTLVAAVPNVRDLRLYCSGNKSVLRSWSGVDGLSRLQKLKRIHVVISQGIDSKERVQANVRFFEEAMANHNPEKHQVLTTEIRDAKDMLAKRADGSEFHYGDDGDDYEKS